MKNLMKLLIVSFLAVSCASFPSMKKPVEVCAINYTYDYCRCALFDFNYGQLKKAGESENRHLAECHKYISLSPRSWVDIINYLDSIYTWRDKNFKRKYKGYNKKESLVITEILHEESNIDGN